MLPGNHRRQAIPARNTLMCVEIQVRILIRDLRDISIKETNCMQATTVSFILSCGACVLVSISARVDILTTDLCNVPVKQGLIIITRMNQVSLAAKIVLTPASCILLQDRSRAGCSRFVHMHKQVTVPAQGCISS